MKLLAFKAEKAPGFRLSVSDLLIGGGAVLTSWGTSCLPQVDVLWPLPVHVFATFFCFCNIFRIGTRQEIFWSATAVSAFGVAAFAEMEPYPFALAITVPTALIAVIWSARRGLYNGIGHRAVHTFFDSAAPRR
jgi:hypothetical protein